MKKFITNNLTTTIVVVLFAVLAFPVHADMYGVNAAGEFFSIDIDTGNGTLVGNLPLSGDSGCCDGYNEIAYDESTQTAWAQERDGNFRAQPFNLLDASAAGVAVENGASWHAWEFIGTTLYAAGFAGVVQNGFATMDPTVGTPSVSVINDGNWETVLLGDVFTGIAYGGGVLYGITNGSNSGESNLFTIDLLSGDPSLVGATGIRAGSLEFGVDGNLYAGGVNSQAGGFFQVSTTTGVATLIGDTGFSSGGGVSGLMRVGEMGVAPAPIMPVPTMSEWALIVLSMLLGLMVFTNRKRLF